jgi:murein L,D-transpeptidase YcbB/YkuD
MMPFHNQTRLALISLVYLGCMACNDAQQKTANKRAADTVKVKQINDASVPGNFSSQTQFHFDSSSISRFLEKYPLFKSLQPDIQKFYSTRLYAYAWYDKHGWIEQADNLYNHVMNMGEEGLPEKILYKDSLSHIVEIALSGSKADPENELMLTAQYFNYAKSAWEGLPEKETKSIDWFLPRKKLDLPQLMDSLLRDSASSLIRQGYTYRQYDLLKNYLKHYREMQSKNDWASIRADQKSYRKGDSSAAVTAIRKRLHALGDITGDSGNALFDESLEEGVKNYQRRLGMKEDGIIGSGTIRTLNQSLHQYIQQIIVNMERCRWVPVSLSGDYLVINIPAFSLFAYENDSLAFTMKVVVGKDVHKTVIFNSDLKYVVFSPYWSVPSGIMKKEVLPAIRRDPGYLAKHNMEWFGKSLRQKPGPKNSLGLVKFLFPNSYDIYLHDTPAKSLFGEDVRAFSHGCIRVEQPKQLAMYLLRDDSRWTSSKVDASMKSGKEQWVTLKSPVPVFIAYLTAWVDRQGKLNLRDDIYKRDDRLATMIAKNGE